MKRHPIEEHNNFGLLQMCELTLLSLIWWYALLPSDTAAYEEQQHNSGGNGSIRSSGPENERF